MTELLSCPFCGGRAAAGRTYNGETTLFKVQCMSCPAAMKGYDQSVADAIDAWNTRAAPAPQGDAESEELAEWKQAASVEAGLRREFLRDLERLRNIGQAMLDALPIGAVVTMGGQPIDHSKLGEVRNELRAVLSPDPGTVAVASAQYRCTCGAEPYCAPNVHAASCPLAISSTNGNTP